MKKILTITFSLLALTFFTKAQTNIPALITSNVTWGPSGNPYLLKQNSYVDTGVTLTILPGTIVKASGGATLTIDGELLAKGTNSSKITFDTLELKFSIKSKGFDKNTQQGVQFDHCNFNGRGSGARIINSSSCSIKVTNSSFKSSYYAIYSYSSQSKTNIIVDNCYFTGDGRNYGYPIYTSGSNNVVNITNSTFEDFYNLYIYGEFSFEKNTLVNYKNATFYAYYPSVVKCNNFKSLSSSGVTLTIYTNYDTMTNIEFTHNTLDSSSLNIGVNSSAKKSSKINHNNLLPNPFSGTRVNISGYNSTPTSSIDVDIKSNYWATMDSATIESYIADYKDNINIVGKAIASSPLVKKVTGCGDTSPCNADFNYIVNFDSVAFDDVSYSANGHTSSWSFGDNTTGNGGKVGHSYGSSGNHKVCLYIYDSVANCRDTICKTITTYDLPKYCKPSFYQGTDTVNSTNIYIIDDSKNTTVHTKYLWVFGDGSSSNVEEPTHSYSGNGPYNLCLTITDSSTSCSKSFCQTIEMKNSGTTGFTINVVKEKDITSINKISKMQVKVYPNPSSGLVTIKLNEESNEDLEVKVLNSMGQIVYTYSYSKYDSELKLNLDHLNNGLYHIVVQGSNMIGSSNVLINK